MNKKILIGCIGAAALLVLVSFNSVVGSNDERLNTENKHISPLFTLRANQRINKAFSHEINSDYLGKGRILNLFPSQRSCIEGWVKNAVKIIDQRPAFVYALLDRADKIPAVLNALNAYDIKINDFKNYLNRIKNNPELYKQEIYKAVELIETQQKQPGNDPQPLGLSTSNPIGCLITIFAFLPLAIILGLIIGTIIIVTCLNIGGCLENLIEGILEALLQGLTPPV